MDQVNLKTTTTTTKKKLLQLARMVYYGKECEEENKNKKEPGNRLKPQQCLLDPLLNSLSKMPRGTQVKRGELVITVEGRGISNGIALRHLSCPQLHVQSARTTLEKRLPPKV